MCEFITVKGLPALGYLYNNVCNDVTCAGMPVLALVVQCNEGKFLFLEKNELNF